MIVAENNQLIVVISLIKFTKYYDSTVNTTSYKGNDQND